MKKICFSALLSGALLVFSACCAFAEETKTVDWYAAPENTAALDAKLAECRNNPGELRDTPNCINARAAANKLLRKGLGERTKVQEPAITYF